MVYSSLYEPKTSEHFSQNGGVNTHPANPLHPSFFCFRMSTGQGMVAHKLLYIWCGYGMKINEGLQCPASSAIFLVCKALEQTWVGLSPLCVEKRVLVL